MNRVLFHILECVVANTNLNSEILKGFSQKDWEELYNVVKRQGITAVTFEKIKALSKEFAPSKELVLRWMAHTLLIEKQTKEIYLRCVKFAEAMHEYGLHTLVLKGAAISQYYPNPWHREYGDLDCYLYKNDKGKIKWSGCYEEGNCIAEQSGCKVMRGHYKHSHIQFEGLEVENHQFALPIKDGIDTKALEQKLRQLVEDSDTLTVINDSCLYCPPADFNALFLTAHSMNHFLYESINLRHIMDWALFLKAEQERVDWECFWSWCERMHYTRFAQCMNYICKTHLGVQIHAFTVNEDEHIKYLSMRILKDIFDGENIYNKGYSTLRLRYELAVSFLKSMWKYRLIYQKNALWLLLNKTIGVFAHKVSLEEND